MLSMIYGRKKRRAISSCLIAVLVIATIAGAVFSAPVAVYALSAGGLKSTIASIIISLLLQTGVAPTNTSWINTLNSSYGYTIETAISEGLLTESAGTLIDTGLSSAIENASAYTELGLGDIFTTTIADGAEVIPASGAVNIANTAIHTGVLGTIGAFAGAAVIGVGVGVLANHVRDWFTRWIQAGCPLDYPINDKELPSGFEYKIGIFYKHFGIYESMLLGGNANTVVVPWENSKYDFGAILYDRVSGSSIIIARTSLNNNWNTFAYSNPYNSRSNTNNNRDVLDYMNIPPVGSLTDAQNLVNNIKNGSVSIPEQSIKSPDIVGNNGNLFYDGEDNIVPGIENQIPTGSDMLPVNPETYNDFADDANQNTDDGNQDANADLFNDLMNDLLVGLPTIPDQPIIPDENVNVPTVPDRPVEPNQPSIPDKPDLGQEDIEEALQGATTIDLRSVFPFCIPFDLYNLILIFDTGENRRAPHINFTFPGTDWIIDVDLAPFDTASGILRLLELIVFIAGLAVATRKLIGAGG